MNDTLLKRIETRILLRFHTYQWIHNLWTIPCLKGLKQQSLIFISVTTSSFNLWTIPCLKGLKHLYQWSICWNFFIHLWTIPCLKGLKLFRCNCFFFFFFRSNLWTIPCLKGLKLFCSLNNLYIITFSAFMNDTLLKRIETNLENSTCQVEFSLTVFMNDTLLKRIETSNGIQLLIIL